MTPCLTCGRPSFGPTQLCTEHRQSTARELANQGMKESADHAEAVEPGWNGLAYGMLQNYARTNAEFMTEDVRVWAKVQGLPDPPDKRAWGSIINRAVRASMLARDRYESTKIPPAHATPRPVWRSNIHYKEQLHGRGI